jgi:hypothetical protein
MPVLSVIFSGTGPGPDQVPVVARSGTLGDRAAERDLRGHPPESRWGGRAEGG